MEKCIEKIEFTPRDSHPFKDMDIGDQVAVKKRLQHYVHSYAANSGKKFHTKTIDGVLYVMRVN